MNIQETLKENEREFDEKFFHKKNVSIVVNGKRIYGPLDKFLFTPNRVKSFLRKSNLKVLEARDREIRQGIQFIWKEVDSDELEGESGIECYRRALKAVLALLDQEIK